MPDRPCAHPAGVAASRRDATARRSKLDLRGLGLVSVGLLGIVWGLVRGNGQGWTSPEIVLSLDRGRAAPRRVRALGAPRSSAPMLPMRFFQNSTFSHANVASFFMFFGMFGSIFLLAQFFQTVQGYSPLQAGLRILPWTAMPIFVAPIAGALSDRIGGQRIMGVGLTLQAIGLGWIAAVSTPTTPYAELIGPFILSGMGMALFFAPVANVVLGACPAARRKARPPVRTTRSVSSVACSVSPCSRRSSPGSAATRRPQSFVDGLVPAVWVGAALSPSAPLRRSRSPRAAERRVGRVETGSAVREGVTT